MHGETLKNITFNVQLFARWAGQSGDRIPEKVRFSTSIHRGPGAHFASAMSPESSPWIKRPGRGADHPPPSSADVNERVELYVYSVSGFSWPLLG